MATAVKRKLTGSTDGMPIVIGNTASPGTTVTQAVAGTTAGTYDEIWLWGYNGHSTTDLTVSIEYGNTTLPYTATIPYKAGLVPLVPGLILQNGLYVRAFASSASSVTISGFINSMTD